MIQSLKFTGVEGREVGPLKRALQNKIKRNVFSLQKHPTCRTRKQAAVGRRKEARKALFSNMKTY